MLKSVTIKNFQSHKNSKLDFSEGVNIIKGPSRNGKSSIFRAIKWVTQNRPTGFAFKSKFARAKEETSVCLEFYTGERITRKRSDTVNEYLIEKPGKRDLILKAMGSTVPEEVTNILNMTDLNIQGQFDSLFFLQDTPGKVANILNSIIGQEQIQLSFSRMESFLRDKRSTSKSTSAKISSIKSQIDEIDKKNIDKILLAISKIEIISKRLDEKMIALQKLKDIQATINRLEARKSDIPQIPIELIDQAILQSNRIIIIKRKRGELEDIAEKLSLLQKRKDVIEKTIVLIGTAIKCCDSLIVKKKTLNYLEDAKSKIFSLSKKRDAAEFSKSELIKKYNDILSENKICPLCGSKIK